ncbi:F-box/kelch-repeat protein At3g23880-like isoform X2 [Cornus florida]|uniref:F-box/kelch-repeat protein At3g23880-like isoform X2 n=1 Tax=Cornus florida TaxID=4283 RepID=UPI00289B5A9C|nr:F-box/kelch-repeat protein At3g23880-like isoform X2 [Cornus florida]
MSDFFPVLPRDVVMDILARLPLNTLVRCTSVCKSWYSLLINPSFITKHLNLNLNRSPHLRIVRSYSDSNSREHYSVRYDDDQIFPEYAKPHFPLKSHCSHYFRIIGVCNGLICLSDDQFTYVNELFLWNPAIRKMMPLPRVRVTFQSHGPFQHTIGFGFDPLTHDYKVIRIVHLVYDFYNPPKTEIDIFSLSTGTWRNISHVPFPLPDIIINERAPQAFLKGAAHWIASSKSSRSYAFGFLILSFHMAHDQFGQIKLPHNITEDANPYLMAGIGFRVAKFQESLALMHLTGTYRDHTCCIWVMKEYGVAESWTKQFNIDITGSFSSVAGFTRKGQLLLQNSAGYLMLTRRA